MSEINSIAQGTYTLGQTRVTTYQAGSGISITQPSEGVVRISNDETVLWSGTLTNGQTANLSETVKNFEKIKIFAHESQRNRNLVSEYVTDYFSTSTMVAICIPDMENSSSKSWFAFYWSRLYFTDATCSAVVNDGGTQTWWAASNGAALNVVPGRYCIIDKIVGINRISGGNA